MKKVIVGMSGGVDSSVTAFFLKERGFDVEGVSLVLWESRDTSSTCCSTQAIEEASKNAERLKITHRVIDARKDFLEKVIKPFVNSYVRGLTPNPCVLCNKHIKFPILLGEADKRGALYIATGHYARVEPEKSIVNNHQSLVKTNNQCPVTNDQFPDLAPGSNHFLLKKGIEPKKDQSYVLYGLGQEELKRLVLPLGDYRKDQVRKIAKELALPAAMRNESQEICFVQDKNYSKFIESLSGMTGERGSIIHISGKVMGTHMGIQGYTVGQRKRLGISSPEPLYVVGIDALNKTVLVGPREAAKTREFLVKSLNWIVLPEALLFKEEESVSAFRATVKVRSTMKDEPATIYMETNPPSPPFAKGGAGGLLIKSARVVFDKPQWAPAPGQSAVFYDGDTVLGGGIIKRLN
ncbi:MAG: tRNA 2-thiouridine(34) synthase MnmA [Nitrospirota bacterium]